MVYFNHILPIPSNNESVELSDRAVVEKIYDYNPIKYITNILDKTDIIAYY